MTTNSQSGQRTIEVRSVGVDGWNLSVGRIEGWGQRRVVRIVVLVVETLRVEDISTPEKHAERRIDLDGGQPLRALLDGHAPPFASNGRVLAGLIEICGHGQSE